MATNKHWVRVNANQTGLRAIEINKIVQEIVQRKVESVTNHPDLRQDIGNVYLDLVTPYVPMNTGTLRESGSATNDGRVYWSAVSPNGFNYTQYVYENEFTNYTTPNTHSHWTDYVNPSTDAWSTFISEITPLIVDKFKEG